MKETPNPIRSIVIVGGGTAGWIAAAMLGQVFKGTDVSIDVVESPEVGIIGVGEATLPHFLDLINTLGIDQVDFIQHTQSTFKWGIEFVDWARPGSRFLHSFGPVGRTIDGHDFYQIWLRARAAGDATPFLAHSPEAVLSGQGRFFLPFEAAKTPLASARYALHLDATLVGQYFARYAQELGVKRTTGHVEQVRQNSQGFISQLQLKDGHSIEGDFFIDCTGFKGLLIEQALHAGYDDWSHYLPCDRAVTVPTERAATTPSNTTATARDAGWSWRIPLQHRIGNGYVYSSAFSSDDEAIATLQAAIDTPALAEPRVIPFVTGMRKQPWKANCLSLGLAQGFMEPLESTAIHLVARSLSTFIKLFPSADCEPALTQEFNRRIRDDYEEIRDFLIMHYCTTQRSDTAFWRHCQSMAIPESLEQTLAMFKATGELPPEIAGQFGHLSWQIVLTGMGIVPKRYNPLVDNLDYAQLQRSLAAGKNAIAQIAQQQPMHDDFIRRYCPAPDPTS